MKERPILFSTEMVKAILEERKTQTRRIMKPQPIHNNGWWVWEGTRPKAKYNSGLTAANYPPNKWLHPPTSPYGIPGDRLWVRETFLVERSQHKDFYEYKADYSNTFAGDVCWKPSIFMPREACRILLEVTDVRVERLYDITEEDARAEGITDVEFYPDEGFPLSIGHMMGKDDGKTMLHTTRVNAYAALWESINGEGSWDKNPWVWVISFKILSHD
jgi:hypothetical protein